MAVLKCKMCGGDLEIQQGSTIAECEYCGTTQTIPSLDNEKKRILIISSIKNKLALELRICKTFLKLLKKFLRLVGFRTNHNSF